MTRTRLIAIETGVTLNVALAGVQGKPPVILLHGFPESHRTWREVEPHLRNSFHLIMPDQRGFGASDHPREVGAYAIDILVEDVFALADALELERFSIIGHDWGGAVAWNAALTRPQRLSRLSIINAPHPVIFQKSLISSEAQRTASQYINAFRAPGFEEMVEAQGFDWFFERTFGRHVDPSLIPESEKRQYIADWSRPGVFTAMLNWYRASRLMVPYPGTSPAMPDWLSRPFPRVKVPTQVIWGMKDKALLPLQLDGLDCLVDDLIVVRLNDAGHFAPWEAGPRVAASLRQFLIEA